MDKINELEITGLKEKIEELEKNMSNVLKKLNLDNNEKTKELEIKGILGDVLYNKIPAYQYVEIKDGGWRIGFTYIDDEDLFMQSLNPEMLDREIENVEIKQIKDINIPIYSISLK